MSSLTQFIGNPWFYVAVAIAAVVVNFIWRFFVGKGKLV